jgi:hypothetical protein
MSEFPGSPKLVRGALVSVSLPNPLTGVVVFQYNPETLTRTLTARTPGGTPDQAEALRLTGPPEEKIKLDIELDATDLMEQGEGATGVGPALASLELMIYPSSTLVIANEVLARLGVVEIVPAEAPQVFFIWGAQRILPVRITEFGILEEAFDAKLVPIRAKVSLGLRVLSYHDLGLVSPGGALFLAHQVGKEVLATLNGAANVSPLVTRSLGF